MKRFLQRNIQIEELSLGERSVVSKGDVQFISETMLNLKNIKLSVRCETDLEHLSVLRHATIELLDSIYCSNEINRIFCLQNITNISLAQIEKSFENNELIVVAQNLQNLQQLKTISKKQISIVTINRIVQLANKLSKFHMLFGSRGVEKIFNENDYNDVLYIVQARETHTKLTMTFESYEYIANFYHDKLIILNHPDLTVFKHKKKLSLTLR